MGFGEVNALDFNKIGFKFRNIIISAMRDYDYILSLQNMLIDTIVFRI